MTGGLTFCPFCGTKVASVEQQFCGSCGKTIALGRPGNTSAGGGASSASPGRATSMPVRPYAAPPQVSAPTGTPSTAARPAGWPEFNSWAALSDSAQVAIPVFLAWLGITLLVTIPLTDAVRNSVYSLPGGQDMGSIGASFLATFLSAGAGAIGSMLAGLNFQISAGGTAGALGSSTNVGAAATVGLVPLLTLTVFGVIAARRARSLARTRGGKTLSDYLRPAVLAAVVTAACLYVGALILTSPLGGSLDTLSGSAGVSVDVHGGPAFSGLLFVLLPTLVLGCVVGALLGGGWPLFLGWFAGRATSGRVPQALAILPLVAYALAGYVVALAAASVVGAILLVVLALANGTDLMLLIRMLPAVVVAIPNAIAILVLAGTGTALGLTTTGAGVSQGPLYSGSLWSAPMEWILAGLIVLVLPGLVAGIIARSRSDTATPGMIAIVGGATGIFALVAAVLAVPSFGMNASVFVAQGSSSMRFLFDFGQAFLVGGLAMIGAAIAGYRFGGSLAEPVSAQVSRLPRPE